MKSARSPRHAPPAKKRQSEGHGMPTPPLAPAQMDSGKHSTKESAHKSRDASNPPKLTSVSSPVTAGLVRDPRGLEQMKKRMGEALARKQEQKASTQSPTKADVSPRDALASGMSEAKVDSTLVDDMMPSITASVSTDSSKTVRASNTTPGSVRTPSYPFPRMGMTLSRAYSSRSGPHHKPFTLLSPTNETPTSNRMPDNDLSQQQQQQTSSEVSTPIGPSRGEHALLENPDYPTPDLYDMVLMLNAEPGLDAWWANVTEILVEAYGAERASLALPGDVTDLENVPWGQKASFCLYDSDSGNSAVFDSRAPSDVESRSGMHDPTSATSTKSGANILTRPPLETRHSIAGATPESAIKGTRERPSGPARAVSTVSAAPHSADDGHRLPLVPRWTRQSPTPQSEPIAPDELSGIPHVQDAAASATSAGRFFVHKTLQPLETERDALLIRTGVASLFGKRKPVVLTRVYSEDGVQTPAAEQAYDRSAYNQTSKPPHREREGSTSTIRAFDEYEQPEPSPWSQSPSPSPAARPDPSESPFFAPPSSVDEEAFSQNPPVHDYGASANLSLSAIGTDQAKTLVHIPLIQPVPSRNVLASSLRFPIAILSFLCPVNPFPANLRQSLGTFLPHLASTFSLAQQYTTLQDRIRGGASIRPGAAFGLGGTFSDEGSELELVNELSTQVQQDRAISKGSSLAGSFYSPSERAAPSRGSPTGSAGGTPALDQLGFSTDFPTTPGRSGTEMVDSYFSAKRNRSGLLQVSRGGQHAPLSVKTSGEESPERMRKPEKGLQSSRGSMKRTKASISGAVSSESPQSPTMRTSSVTSESSADPLPVTGGDRSDATYRRPAHRDSLRTDDGEKPLPELIAALMLNAVPLQLFLAKPNTGDLVWTNRKFDAFRSQGEGRVRDPWKNVHSEDRPGLVKTWDAALKNGNQFTHYIRVKRFNSDSDFRWFVFRASTMLSNDGRLLYWIGSFLDIHDQYMKNLEAQEMEANMARDAKLRALADAIPQVLFEAVEGEGIVSVNQQWHTYSGQSLDEARGLGFARHVHRDDLHKCGMLSPVEALRTKSDSGSSSSSSTKTAQPSHPKGKSLFAPDDSSLATMIQRGSMMAESDENGRVSYTTEIRLRSKGGEFRWFLVRLVKVQNESLQTAHASWYGTCTDIETRMNLERKLNEANKKVNSEMESKTKFFANMSHEIRTPLNGILGSMPWLVESALDHDQRRTLDTIQNSANNLRELVDNILDVTKVEAGKMALVPKWFHVRSLCEEVVDTCSSRAIERGLELNYSLDAEVPATVKGDPFRVRQVLLNLMGNSVKFTEQGEVFLRCALKPNPDRDDSSAVAFLHFHIVDTGRGFNEAEFQRLFKQFGQIEGANQHDAGSGLGLFLSKQLVEMHGGELSVSSRAGEGSTFSFYVQVEVSPVGVKAVSPQHPTSLRPLHRQSVSFGSVSPSQSDPVTPIVPTSKDVVYTPGLSKYTSPDAQSPSAGPAGAPSPSVVSPIGASDGSGPSVRSNSGNVPTTSSISSNLATPESMQESSQPTASTAITSERQASVSKSVASLPPLQRAQLDSAGGKISIDQAHPQTYSIVVICPAENARTAIKQHIEHVVPHQIPVNVTCLKDIGSFMELRNGPSPPVFTHVVLDVPASSDVMLFMRQMATVATPIQPALIIVTDHYQKRDILEDFSALTTAGRRAFLIHKPVKPSVFAMIFDPAQQRILSKDRAREVAQSSSDDFKNIANHVKEKIGNRAFRLLLVEDSDTNRLVIQRYLRRVGLQSDEARNGQECVDMVRSRSAGHYSLIICDIQMPKMNGYDACMEIRRWERDNMTAPCPIMALTANAMPEERAAAAAAGFTDYLTKPVDFNRLGQLMVQLLDPTSAQTLLRDRPMELGMVGKG